MSVPEATGVFSLQRWGDSDAPPLGPAPPGGGSRCGRAARGRCRSRLLGSCLSTVARTAPRLAVGNVAPRPTHRDGHDLIHVRLALSTARSAAGPARPGISRQHRLPPCTMGVIAVAANGGAGPRAVVATAAARYSRRLVAGDAGRHGSDRSAGGGVFSGCGLRCVGETPATPRCWPRCRARGPWSCR